MSITNKQNIPLTNNRITDIFLQNNKRGIKFPITHKSVKTPVNPSGEYGDKGISLKSRRNPDMLVRKAYLN